MRKILLTSIAATILAAGAGAYIHQAAHRNDAAAAVGEDVDVGPGAKLLVRSLADGRGGTSRSSTPRPRAGRGRSRR